MFNTKLKKEAEALYEKVATKYNSSYGILLEKCEELYETREKSIEVINEVIDIANSIENMPEQLKNIMEINVNGLQKFEETCEFAKATINSGDKTGMNIFTSAAAGVAFADLAPKTAMLIATTFGKASTGVAIKALSGIAAKNAALAWLGGGALAAGGAGMAGGQAVLALAGPIGWTIGGVASGASLISKSIKNKKDSEYVIEEAKKILKESENLHKTTMQINELNEKTQRLKEKLLEQIDVIKLFEQTNYDTMNEQDKELLKITMLLINDLVESINDIVK